MAGEYFGHLIPSVNTTEITFLGQNYWARHNLMALFLRTYIYQKKALRAQNMNFEKLKEKVDRIPHDAGSKDEPIIF